jgi:hypothetical protein
MFFKFPQEGVFMKYGRYVFPLLALIISSCAATITPVVLDEQAAEGETAVVYFATGDKRFTPVAINGIQVGKKVRAVQIGVGPAELSGEFYCLVQKGVRSGSTTTADKAFSLKEAVFTYRFEADKSYYIESELDGTSGERVLVNLPFKGTVRVAGPEYTGGVNVYEVKRFNKRQEPLIDERDILDFVYLEGNITF